MALNMNQIALKYRNAGLSVIPIRGDGSKAPAVSWQQYIVCKPSENTVLNFFNGNGSNKEGVAIICGGVSGNLECLDFDDPFAFEQFKTALPDTFDLKNFPVQLTPSSGHHLVYRCQHPIPGNMKLARILDDNKRPKTYIETRGEGGYFIAYPSPGNCHPTGIEYRLIQGSFSNIPTITFEQRNTLIETAKSLNSYIEEHRVTNVNQSGLKRSSDGKPGDEYNQKGNWNELLKKHGWKLSYTKGTVEYWLRPGKPDNSGISATLNGVRDGIFYVFSSNADPFEPDQGYDLFGAYTWLEHNGDFTIAAQTLARDGYGTPVPTPHIETVFHYTDYGNACRLIKKHGESIRYCDTWGSWLIWDGHRWQPDEKQMIMTFAKDTVTDLWDDTSKLGKKFAAASENFGKLKAMLQTAESEQSIAVTPNQFDTNDWLFNVRNGTIDLLTGIFYSAKKTDYITKIANVIYDPNKTCPNWEQFLNDIFEGKFGLIDYLRRVIGYSITGSIREQSIFILYGGGRNGKSTFINLIRDLVGDYGAQADPRSFLERQSDTVRDDLAALAGVRLVSAVETSEGRRLDEGIVKQMTGGEAIRCRHLYQKPFEYTPKFAPFLTTNHKPMITGTDKGIWRRINLIPFTVEIPKAKVNKSLPRILEQEKSGILNWILDGCIAWQRNGLNTPDEINAATMSYRYEMDSIGQFIDEICVEAAEYMVGASKLYQHYKYWISDRGEGVLSQKRFGSRMSERGFERIRNKNGWFYKGINIMEDNGGLF